MGQSNTITSTTTWLVSNIMWLDHFSKFNKYHGKTFQNNEKKGQYSFVCLLLASRKSSFHQRPRQIQGSSLGQNKLGSY